MDERAVKGFNDTSFEPENDVGDIMSKGHTVLDKSDMSRLGKRQEFQVSFFFSPTHCVVSICSMQHDR
jgi:hypothetical protein